MTKVLGGSGFIGFHVEDCLSESGYKVTIYDNIKSLWQRKDQKMVIGNILNFEELKSITEGAKFVYNFAAIAENLVEFTDERNNSHYIRTPYAYQPKLGGKYTPPTHEDFGQGLFQIISEIDSQ
tara:strand:- start:134 stop:505 length:372 start_codon:yes stop_codon:yes gene_type:complete